MSTPRTFQGPLAALVGAALALAPVALAADRMPPDAPADYLAKTNPKKDDKAAQKRGADLYQRKCEKCHGVKGDGKGKSAEGLNPPVRAFSDPGYLAGRKDGQLFWIIEQGSPKTDMEAFGPGTSYNMSADDIWAITAYLRTRFTK
jgi:mono/diheme cytochrome c family protein